MDRNNLKFTASANPEAEALLRKALEGIRSDIAAHNLRGLAGVYLGGGYGRGEGGVFCKNGTVRLYNDLDFLSEPDLAGQTKRISIPPSARFPGNGTRNSELMLISVRSKTVPNSNVPPGP